MRLVRREALRRRRDIALELAVRRVQVRPECVELGECADSAHTYSAVCVYGSAKEES